MSAQPKPSFFKEHVLPLLLIFVIPIVAIAFFTYAENKWDAEIRRSLEPQIEMDAKLPREAKARAREYFRHTPVSQIMASSRPEDVALQPMFSSAASDYWMFRWAKRIGWICLATTGMAVAGVGLSVLLSMRSQAAQYTSLLLGIPFLKLSAAVQVTGQAALAVALSYWLTAVFFEVYVIKLILIVGICAVAAVGTLLAAIFARPVERDFQVQGSALAENDAPELWSRVRELAAKARTAPPDQILVGVSPDFYVTELPVHCGDTVYRGRTLYLSLTLLKILSMEEADAIFGHELAHFSGNDTLWAKRISPLIGKFEAYIARLYEGYTVIVGAFMVFFWKLYHLSMKRLSRARELRADRLGAQLSSPHAAARSLVKTTCYGEYRIRTQTMAAHARSLDYPPDLVARLERNYPAFRAAFASTGDAIEKEAYHPFDSHPTTKVRVAKLGEDVRNLLQDPSLNERPAESWYHAIRGAAELEARLWPPQREIPPNMAGNEEIWNLRPVIPPQTARLQEFFPRRQFQNERGVVAVVEADRISAGGWAGPLFFRDILSASVEDSPMGRRLVFIYVAQSPHPHISSMALHEGTFRGAEGDLISTFHLYYSRFRHAAANAQGAGL